MKKILLFAVMLGLAGGVYANGFETLSGMAPDVKVADIPVVKQAVSQDADVQTIIESVATAEVEMAYGAQYMFDQQFPSKEGLARINKAVDMLDKATEAVLRLVPAYSTPDEKLNRAAKLLRVMGKAIQTNAVAYKLVDEQTHTYTNKPFVAVILKAGSLQMAAMTLEFKTGQK